MHPGQGTTRSRSSWITAEARRFQAKGPQGAHHASVVEDATFVMDVVANPWGQHVKPADRADDLTMRVDLQVMDQRVVLKHYRQARIVAEQLTAQLWPGPRQSP